MAPAQTRDHTHYLKNHSPPDVDPIGGEYGDRQRAGEYGEHYRDERRIGSERQIATDRSERVAARHLAKENAAMNRDEQWRK